MKSKVVFQNKGQVSSESDIVFNSKIRLVSERTVRELDAKYKNPEQSQVAKMQQNHDGGSLYRQQEQVRKKDIKEITFDDLKVLDNLAKVKQVAKYLLSKKDWFEQQAKQNEAKIADLENKNALLQDRVQALSKFFMHVRIHKSSDAQLGKEIRAAAERFLKVQDKERAHSTTKTPIEKEKTAPAQQEQEQG